MTRAALLALSLSGAALILLLLIEIHRWLDGSNLLAQLASTPLPTETTDARTENVTPTALLATILARPLFLPSRQPADERAPPPPGLPPVAAQPAFKLPRLAGVMVGSFGRSAIFAASSPVEKPIVAGIGAKLGPYEVVAIAAGAVTVRGPQGDQVLAPGFDGAAGGTPGGAAGPPASQSAPGIPMPPPFRQGPGRLGRVQ